MWMGWNGIGLDVWLSRVVGILGAPSVLIMVLTLSFKTVNEIGRTIKGNRSIQIQNHL